MASFGVLHRNEESGALSGLTRVRRFQQDDAHIFATPEQVQSEVLGALKFVQFIYHVIGLKFSLVLSTRPKKAIGTKEQWAEAEKSLESALNLSGHEWSFNKGDGAFYGPKIDIRITDAIGRAHQCATIQLDFQLPMRFNLQFMSKKGEEELGNADAAKAALETAEKEDLKNPVLEAAQKAAEKEMRLENHGLEGKVKPGYERPVMIHRAIFGSVERFTAILCEHFGGKWPFFLSPRQICIVPTHAGLNDYCEWLAKQYQNFGLFADADLTGKQFKKKIAVAQTAQYNYILVCGDKEKETLGVNIRDRDLGRSVGDFTLRASIEKFLKEAHPNSKEANTIDSFEGREVPGNEAETGTKESATKESASKEKKPEEKTGAKEKKPSEVGFAKKSDAEWEAHFAKFPYVKEFEMSDEDKSLFEGVQAKGAPTTPNFTRWFEHLQRLKLGNKM